MQKIGYFFSALLAGDLLRGEAAPISDFEVCTTPSGTPLYPSPRHPSPATATDARVSISAY
jgi:hypothetical protein